MPKRIYTRTKPAWNKGMKGWTNNGSFKIGHPSFNIKQGYFIKCFECGKEIYIKPSLKDKRKYCSNRCSKINKVSAKKGKKYPQCSGENNSFWKGGRYKSLGYIHIYKPNHPFAIHSHILEHRLVIEKQIGRYLKPSEKTHHLGAKDDNRPHMLMAFIGHSAHTRFHTNPNNVKLNEIVFDGRLL